MAKKVMLIGAGGVAGVAAAKAAAAGTDVKVALDIGPLATMLKPLGTMSDSEAAGIYEEIISSGMDGNPDMIVLETFMDAKMLKIACEIASGCGIPVLCSMSFGKRGRTIMGDSPASMIKTLEPYYPAAVGINCSYGPQQSLEVFKKFAEATDMPLLFKPNAGLPVNVDGTEYPYTAEMFAQECMPVLDRVSYIGSCCGSNPDYIRALAAIING